MSNWYFIKYSERQFHSVSFPLKYREIITVKIVTLYKKLYLSLKSNRKKLALERWLSNSRKPICIGQSGFCIFSHPREFKNV